MNNENLYGTIMVEKIKFIQKGKELELTTVNNLNHTKNKNNLFIMDLEIIDDETILFLDNLKKGTIEITTKIKKCDDGSVEDRVILFENVNFIRKSVDYYCDNFTYYRYIFADCSRRKFKKIFDL